MLVPASLAIGMAEAAGTQVPADLFGAAPSFVIGLLNDIVNDLPLGPGYFPLRIRTFDDEISD